MNQLPARVLFVAAEAFPMAKVGGLADVAGALPQALRGCGLDARLMMPAYPSAMAHVREVTPVMHHDDIGGFGPVDFLAAQTIEDGLPIWLIRSQRFFERLGGPYSDEHGVAWPDNLERFALLCNAAALFAAEYPQWQASVVHANDWHTALIPSLLLAQQTSATCLLTIHNASHQGHASLEQLRSFGVPAEHLASLPASARSFLGVGVSHADHLNAVSPTYAREIQTSQAGCGLERLFASRSRSLEGILNGADYRVWDPRHDALIAAGYDDSDLGGKTACREALIQEMGLETASFAPLLGVVSRLSEQKGLDLLIRIADILVTSGARMVVLGEGEPELEKGFRALAARYPRRVAANIRYDEALAHRIMAGADIFLMPSRFEPCGLNQLYALRYGSVPVVAAVGGLADSVTDAGQVGVDRGQTTGFAMHRFLPTALSLAIGKAMAVYPINPLWQALQRNGMRQDFSWTKSAERYTALYSRLASSAA